MLCRSIDYRVCISGLICGFAAVAIATAHETPDLAALRQLSIEELMEIEIPTVYGASKQSQKITETPALRVNFTYRF